MPSIRYHTVIFVETEADGSGYVHHVTGDLVSGMRYECTKASKPEQDDTRQYHSKELLGIARKSDHPTTFTKICERLPPPPKQKAFNPKTMRTEPIKPDGRFYTLDEPRPKLIKCTEWTEIQATPALLRSGLIKPAE
ncbi:hypothetical protein HII31_13075 [Pseudocercospora fuligena]|uniref:Uncharacterized protein n=1 Tax=Pseudocercospora fuligena TaxID=685502 RepID=A0A8H6VAZ8_9PEZI|nr:hypothetical protein HII31_13075 [Pseudocercospora fuligena]